METVVSVVVCVVYGYLMIGVTLLLAAIVIDYTQGVRPFEIDAPYWKVAASLVIWCIAYPLIISGLAREAFREDESKRRDDLRASAASKLRRRWKFSDACSMS